MTPLARRMGRLATRLVAAALATAGLGAAVLAWRLSRGPIPLDVLTPRLEAALSQPDGSLAVHVEATELLWEGVGGPPELRVHGIRALGPTGETVATAPALALRLSVRALLRGVVAPVAITILGPRLRLVREADGRIDLGVGEEAGAAADLPALAGRLFAGPGSSGVPLGRLEVRDGELLLLDRRSAHVWRVPDVDLELRPGGGAPAARATARLVLGSRLVPLAVEAYRRPGASGLDVHLSFRGLDPAALVESLASRSPLAALAANVRLALDGRLRLLLDGVRPVGHARLKVAGRDGALGVSGVPAGGLAVGRLRLAATADLATQGVRLDGLVLDLGGPVVHARGRLHGFDAARAVQIEGTVRNLPTDALGRYWPEAALPAARRWVTTNVTGGQVRELDVRLAGRLTAADPAAFTLETISGSLAFDGLAVRCLDSLPPLTRVAGTGRFTRQAVAFRVGRGSMAGLDLVRAAVDLPAPGDGHQRIVADAVVRGPLAKALALAGEPPPGWAREAGIAPGDATGTVTAEIRLTPTLGAAGSLADVPLRLSARIQQAAVPRLLGRWSLSGGELEVELDPTRLRVSGDARVEGVPVTLAWTEDLTGRARLARRIDAAGLVDAAGRAALGFDQQPWLDGPTSVKADYTVARGAPAKVDLDVDLTPATLDLPLLAIRKRAGEAGRARLEVTMSGEVVQAVDHFDLRAGALRVTGQAARKAGGTMWESVDAEVLLGAASPGDQPGRLILAVRPGGALSRVSVASNDAGVLFRALGAGANARGGRLEFEGTADLNADGLPIDGQVVVHDFTLTRSPVLARVATLASLSGIAGLFSGQGLPFTQLSTGVSHRQGVITMRDGVARSRSLAVTWRGTIDRHAGTVALEGTLVPAYYGLNQAPGRLPVIGTLITGTRGEGIQVVDFTVKGTLEKPSVSARASSLAPGVVRDLLRLLPR